MFFVLHAKVARIHAAGLFVLYCQAELAIAYTL